MNSITCDELYYLISNNYSNNIIILDVRERSDYKKGHILNAINFPLHSLLSKSKLSYKYEYTYYVICDLGISSPKGVNHLTKLGYCAINVLGGMKNWKHELYR